MMNVTYAQKEPTTKKFSEVKRGEVFVSDNYEMHFLLCNAEHEHNARIVVDLDAATVMNPKSATSEFFDDDEVVTMVEANVVIEA